MKLYTIRLLLVATVFTVALSLGPNAPDLPREPGGHRFQFGVSLLAEDCADGSAEHQQCGGSFGIDPDLGNNGGGGGGGQQSEVCGRESTDCESNGCKGEENMGYSLDRMACRFNGMVTKVWAERPHPSESRYCCFKG